jgi:hypothetical protein
MTELHESTMRYAIGVWCGLNKKHPLYNTVRSMLNYNECTKAEIETVYLYLLDRGLIDDDD